MIKIIRSAVGSMPSWGLIEELQNAGIEVIGIDSDIFSYGLHRLSKNYVVPRGDAPNFIHEILNIIDIEQPDAILSGPEEELLTLSKNKNRIEEKGTVVLCPDYKYVAICADKERTNEVFKQMEIPIPEIYNSNALQFPCIIKPRFGRGSTAIFIANNPKEFLIYIKKVEQPLIQEFVEGDEYTVDILADKEGNPLSVVPRLRIQTESGISVKSKTVYDETIINYCVRIAKELKLFGPSCVQCIKNKEGVFFIDVNPRFGGGAILSIKADPSIVPNLIKIIKGENPKRSKEFKEGLIMLRNYTEVFFGGWKRWMRGYLKNEKNSCGGTTSR